MFILFDVIHERDRRTDGQTDRRTLHDSIDHACIASRGKNREIFIPHMYLAPPKGITPSEFREDV